MIKLRRSISSWKSYPSNIKTLLLSILLDSMAFYLILPLLSIYFLVDAHLSYFEIGVLIGTPLFMRQFFSLLAGHFIDRHGVKLCSVTGGIIGIFGFILLPLVSQHTAIFYLPLILIGIASGAINMACKTGLAYYGTNHPEIFAVRNLFLNLGAIAGPFIAGFLLSYYDYLFIFSSLLYLALTLISAKHLQPITQHDDKPAKDSQNQSSIAKERKPASSTYLILVLMTFAFWLVYGQLLVLMPLYIKESLNLESIIGVLFSLGAITVLLVQYIMIHINATQLKEILQMILGYCVCAIAFFFVYLLPTIIGFTVFVILFSAAEVLILPATLALVKKCISRENLGKAYGYLGLAAGLATLVGTSITGLIFSVSTNKTAELSPFLWSALFLLVLVCIAAVYWKNTNEDRDIYSKL